MIGFIFYLVATAAAIVSASYGDLHIAVLYFVLASVHAYLVSLDVRILDWMQKRSEAVKVTNEWGSWSVQLPDKHIVYASSLRRAVERAMEAE